MDKKLDEIVRIDVQDAKSAVTPTALNTMAILVVDSDAESEFSIVSVDDKDDLPEACATAGASFFGETNHPESLGCAVTKTLSDSSISSALDAALEGYDFYNMNVIRTGVASSSAANEARLIKAANKWATENARFVHFEYDDFDAAIEVAKAIKEDKFKRVSVFFHGEEHGESMLVALCAQRCADDPAKGTWAHKELENVSPDKLTSSQLKAAKTNGVNVYVNIAGANDTVFGTAGTATLFIDSQLKKDLVRFRVQEELFNVLRTANNGEGVEMDTDEGLETLGAACGSVLARAQENHYIRGNYSVTVPKAASITGSDKSKRNVSGIKLQFGVATPIHTIDFVTLEIVA